MQDECSHDVPRDTDGFPRRFPPLSYRRYHLQAQMHAFSQPPPMLAGVSPVSDERYKDSSQLEKWNLLLDKTSRYSSVISLLTIGTIRPSRTISKTIRVGDF